MKILSPPLFLAAPAARCWLRAARLLPLAALLSAAPSASAATGTWLGATDATWAADTNWSSGAHPVSGDTAFFLNSAATVNGRTTVDLGTGQAAAGVTFDTANAAPYVIGAGAVNSQTLTLDTTAAITMTSAVASNELFNASVVLGTSGAGAALGTTTITNSATAASGFALTFAGAVTGGTGGTAGAKTVNVAGTGAVNFTNVLGAGGSTGLNLINIGTGAMTLSGAGTSALNTLRATANGTVTVNGPTVTVAASSVFGGGSTTYGRFILTSGSAAFNGGIATVTNPGDNTLVRVDGGTFSAASISFGRTLGYATLPTAASTASGFIVNGGTANVTGAVILGTSNSSASALVNGGALTVGGAINLGAKSAASTRYDVFEVRSGSLVSTDTANGIVLDVSTTIANNSEFLVTGGTTTVQRIGFGVANAFAGSTGTLAQTGGSLYVGSGGIVLGSANSYTAAINLTGGLLGAQADWSSPLPFTLGTNPTIQTADALGVAHNITITGVVGGTAFTKTGAGVLTLTGANTFTGMASLNAGTANINGVNALGGGNYAGLTFNGGTLQYAAGATGNGSLDISGIGVNPKPVTVGAGGATIDTNGNAVTYSFTVGNNGTGVLTKIGAGTLTLAAASTFTGGTNANGGTLAATVNGALGSGSTTVAAGATLELGTGVTAAHSAATSTLTLASTASIVMLDAAAGTVQDSVAALIVNGVSEPFGTYGGTGSGAGAILPEFMGTGVLAVVPEPSTWACLLGGLAGLTAWALRRRRTA